MVCVCVLKIVCREYCLFFVLLHYHIIMYSTKGFINAKFLFLNKIEIVFYVQTEFKYQRLIFTLSFRRDNRKRKQI